MQPGARVNHFEIVSSIGRGGMGEVWRARDSKLRRDVALKSLPPEFSRDADRLARFEREATLLASLNHTNIASIYGLEEHEGARFLVLELVEGSTLEELLRTGPLGVDEALKAALQIAQALEAAHERGVIHRDLKPANIKVTADGAVKVLDFGLAKATAQTAGDFEAQTALRTEIGAVMGTPPYMSPEQARGETAGRQTDIWSFGVVLYEMLTGISPFAQSTTAETLARVLDAQPDYGVLPAKLPGNVRHLLRRCLEKDRKRRAQHIGDVRIELEDALAGHGASAAADAPPPAANRRRLVVSAVLLAGAALGGIGVWSLVGRTAAEPPGIVRLSMQFAEAPYPLPFGTNHVDISADGSQVAFASAAGLMIRSLRDGTVATIAGNPVDTGNPFFSPDGEWVGYFGDNGIRKVSSRGGTAQTLAPVTERVLGGTWGPDNTIVFATPSGLFSVSAEGGAARLLVGPNAERGELIYAWPELMPDGQSLLFTVLTENSVDTGQIAWLDLKTLESQTVLKGGVGGRYAATGHLVYATSQSLFAVPFDPATHVTSGAPKALANTTVATFADYGAAEFAISSTGTLVSIAPRAATRSVSLVWIDRQGKEEAIPIEPGQYLYPRVSPDGTRILLDVVASSRDVWMFDLGRSVLTRLTSHPGEDILPMWSVDGRRVFYSSNRAGTFDVYSQAADGSGDAKLELGGPLFHGPNSFTPDGKQLVVFEEFRDLSVLDLASSELKPLLHREFSDRLAAISPDGNWMAFESDEAGPQIEIMLRPFPDVNGRREKISLNGGRYPNWGAPGTNELYYVGLDGAMMAARVETEPTLRLGAVTKLFDSVAPPRGVSGRPYDSSPLDGRFLLTKPVGQGTPQPTVVAVVLNWFTELREQVPVR